MYTLTDVAKIMGVRIRTVYQWIHDGRIQTEPLIGGDKRRLYVSEKELNRLIARKGKGKGVKWQNGNKD